MNSRCALFAFCLFLLALTSSAQQSGSDVEEVNRAAGFQILPSSGQWSGKEFEKYLNRCGLFLEGSEGRRSVYLEDRIIFDVPATELLMICDPDGAVSQLDIIYSNKGDSANSRTLRRDIRKSGQILKQNLKSILGTPRNETFGPAGMQKKVLAWSCNDVRFLLEVRSGEYTILHVCYREEGSRKPKKRELRISGDQFLDNVRTTKFGDVYLENIPMVNQGNKGYCVPATLERVLRYFGITNINMHQLADAAATGRGGGTSFDAMIGSVSNLCRKYGLKVYSCGEIRIETLERYISQGFPVMWGMFVNSDLLELMDESRRLRPKDSSPLPWLQSIRKYRMRQGGEGHICLIVGFNEETGEIAISNSWGDQENEPAWIPLKLALCVSQKTTFVLVPGK